MAHDADSLRARKEREVEFARPTRAPANLRHETRAPPRSRRHQRRPGRGPPRPGRGNAKEGLFEHLRPHVAASSGNDARTLEMMSKDVAEGGIFLYSKEEKECIHCTNFNGKSEEKKSCR